MPNSSPAASITNSAVAGTAAFSKFVHLLQLVADTDDALTVAELSKRSGYPRPTVHRTVAALIAERLLEESPRTGKLALGPRLVQLASRSWARSELRLASIEDLKRLRDITGETIHLAVLNGQSMVYVEKLESLSAVRMTSRIGTNVALHSSAVGKAFLAALDDTHCQNLVSQLAVPFPGYTANTITKIADLREQLGDIRKRGWSVDDEEQEPGIYCFGSTICGSKGQPIAAISVSTLRFRQKDDPIKSYVQPLLETCQMISRRIAETPAFSDAESF